MKSRKSMTLGFVLSAVACSGEGAVDLGEHNPARSGEKLEDYAAVWVGYAEAFQFEDGSDKIRLALDEEGQGVLEVGDAAPPVTSNPDDAPGNGTAEQILAESLLAGFEYSVRLANVESARLRAKVLPEEAYRAWCELQAPLLDETSSTPEAPRYSCNENQGFLQQDENCFVTDPGTGQFTVPIDCGKLFACQWVCVCTEHGCSVPEPTDPSGYSAELDAALAEEGNELVGTLRLFEDQRVTVRLTRQ